MCVGGAAQVRTDMVPGGSLCPSGKPPQVQAVSFNEEKLGILPVLSLEWTNSHF